EGVAREPQERAWACCPMVLQTHPPAATDVHPHEAAGKRVEAGREDNAVQRILPRARANTLGRDRFDRRRLEVDQRDVAAVERLEVRGIERRALGAEGMLRNQLLGDLRVAHALADLRRKEL